MPLMYHRYLTDGDSGASYYTEITEEELQRAKEVGRDDGDGYDMFVSKEGHEFMESIEDRPHVKRKKRPVDITVLIY